MNELLLVFSINLLIIIIIILMNEILFLRKDIRNLRADHFDINVTISRLADNIEDVKQHLTNL